MASKPDERSYATPPTTVGEPSPAHPLPQPPEPTQPIAKYPRWRYHKDKGAVVVDGAEQEDEMGEGWQDTPVVFGPEDTKGMKATDEALKKYTDAVYPKGWRDDGKRTDADAIAAAKAAREAMGVKDDEKGEGKKDELAKKEAERVEKDAKDREKADQDRAKATARRGDRE